MRVTMKDLAEKLGVSRSAVSLAIRNDPRISQDLRDRVNALAKEVGYERDPALGILATHRKAVPVKRPWSCLAFVTESRPVSKREKAFKKRLDEIDKTAQTLGYNVDRFYLSDYSNLDHLWQVIISRGIPGVIFGQLSPGHSWEKISWDHFSAVQLNWGYDRLPMHMVASDAYNYGELFVGKLVTAGARRIGFATFVPKNHPYPEYVMPLGERLTVAGLRESVISENRFREKDKIEFVETCAIHNGFDGQEKFISWIKQNRIDGVVGLNDVFYMMLKDAGIRMPDEVQLALINTNHIDPENGIAGLVNGQARVAKRAVEFLDELIRLRVRGVPEERVTVAVSRRFVEGATLRKTR